jgi:hypothetical protein
VGIVRPGLLQREAGQGETLLGDDHKLLRLAHAQRGRTQAFLRLRDALAPWVGVRQTVHDV